MECFGLGDESQLPVDAALAGAVSLSGLSKGSADALHGQYHCGVVVVPAQHPLLIQSYKVKIVT